ncbi:MAG TPA: hypothetical protein VGF99_20630 [Myxococcota bacterium]
MRFVAVMAMLCASACLDVRGELPGDTQTRSGKFIERWGELGVPLEGRVVYGPSIGDVTCTPPTWSSVHPDKPELDWIPIRRGVLADVGRAHEDAPTTGEVFVAVRAPNLLEDASLFAIGRWGGSEIACNGVTLTAGAPIIIGGFHGERELTPALSDEEWTVLVDEPSDQRLVVDLDVAVDISE